MKCEYLVVGAGLTGVFSALKLAQKGKKVLLLDKAEVAGGLMSCDQYCYAEQNVEFDKGTHYLLLTGVPEVDDLLLSCLDESQWKWFETSLPEGHFAFGKLDAESGCLNIKNSEQYSQYALEYLELKEKGLPKADNLLQKWASDFGEALTENVLIPIADKFCKLPPEELAVEAIGVFCPYRLRYFEKNVSEELKKSAMFDNSLGYWSRIQGQSGIKKGYPIQRGIGLLVQNMLSKILELGGIVHLASSVSQIEYADGVIQSLEVTTDKERWVVEPEYVIGTIPPMAMSKTLGVELPPSKMRFRPMTLVHIIVDIPYKEKELHWVTNYQPEHSSFRVTLYNNIAETDVYKLTIEVIDDFEAVNPERIFEELLEMGILYPETQILFSSCEYHPFAYPVYEPGWQDKVKAQAESLNSKVENFVGVGPASGKVFGQINVLTDANRRLNRLI